MLSCLRLGLEDVLRKVCGIDGWVYNMCYIMGYQKGFNGLHLSSTRRSGTSKLHSPMPTIQL